jgi:hypothetical protein
MNINWTPDQPGIEISRSSNAVKSNTPAPRATIKNKRPS